MKKIMVYAYTQFNLGDDLFIKILCERYPDTTFFIYAPQAYKTSFKQYTNIRVIPSDCFALKILNRISSIPRLIARRCDAVVHIGGSLFIQDTNWRKTLKQTKQMRISGKPFFLLGANFGPFQDQAFYEEHKQVFVNDTDICFREKHSYERFKALDHVRMAADIVFQLQKPAVQQEDKHIVISVIKPSIRKHLADDDAVYYGKIKEITRYFIKRGFHVTFMAFCTYEKDHEAIDQIIKLLPADYRSSVGKHVHQLHLEETLNIIASAAFIIATRFHAMILGWVYGKPVFPITYSDKMKHVMHDIGFSGAYTDFTQLESVQPATVFASMQEAPLDISQQREDAENHFAKLDLFVKGK